MLGSAGALGALVVLRLLAAAPVARAGEGLTQEVSQTSVDELRASGAWTTVRRPGHTLLVAAVPDGVARVEAVLPSGRSPYTKRR